MAKCFTTMTLGTLCVKVESTKVTSFRTLQQQYGDGYMARRQDGLNPVSETWSVSTPVMPYEQTQALEDELIRLGTKPFAWTAPNETTAKNWILDPVRWDWSYATDSLASLTFVLKRWYQ